MGVGVEVKWSNRDLFAKLASGHGKKMAQFGALIGVRSLSSATRRLVRSYTSDGHRTGLLQASLVPGASKNIMDVHKTGDRVTVTVGTRVRYAAQRNFGGTIRPVPPGKALAIPVNRSLVIRQLSPRDLDPDRSVLAFIPSRGGKPNTVGVLVDPKGGLGYGKGVLFVLVKQVTQIGVRFLAWDREDKRFVIDELYPEFLDRM